MDDKKVEQLANLLNRLNQGNITDELRQEALQIVSNIDPVELSLAEQKLIQDGMNPEDLRNLCDVHMEVLSDELDKVKNNIDEGHVIDTLINEHEKLKEFLTNLEDINSAIQLMKSKEENTDIFKRLVETSTLIIDAENHHLREENVLFPELEKRGITGPTRIMRMEHDELRLRKKTLKDAALNVETMDFKEFKSVVDEAAKYIIFNLRDHIYKENHILYPTAIERIEGAEIWKDMKERCDKVGYCSFTPGI
ncbi:MAG: DUF438 domain-containing protein [Clostridiales bacterium]|nr:DUF438 domain-containing protein [Clostridiales bacterium]